MTHPAEMNNCAAHLIDCARYDDAIMVLGKSLKKVKLIMSGDAKIPAYYCREGEAVSCDFSSSGNSFLRTFGGSEARNSAVFRDTVIVRGLPPSTELDKCELLSYAILYNLALVHHLKAIDVSMSPSSNQAKIILLNKAMALYEHAHHILMHQDEDVSLVHTMAIASNLGHAHHMLGDEHKARMCFQHLLSTILYVVDCGEGGKINAFDGFFKNVMPLLSSISSAPAA